MLVNSLDLALLEAMCWALTIGFAGYLWFHFTAEDNAAVAFLPKLFGFAFLFRAVAAILISKFLKVQVNYDASTYEYYGSCYAAFWSRAIISPPQEYLPSLKLNSELVGLQYYLTGSNTFIPDITNAFFGALVPCVIYDIGRRHLGEREGRAAGVFAALLTAWIIWSAIAMRDIYVILLIALVIRDAIDMQIKVTALRCIRIVAWLALIYLFRPYVDLILLLSLSITFTFTLAKRPLARFVLGFVLLCFIGAAVFVGGVQAVASQIIENQTQQLDNTRQVVVYKDDHAYGADVRYTSISDVLKFLPVGLVYFLGGPFPWSYDGRQFLMSLPEIFSWYFIFYYGIRGTVFVRGKSTALLPLLTFFLVGAVLLSAVSGNFAISIRHRSMLSISLVLLAGVGWVHRKDGRSGRPVSS
jgi:hypothetical protein